MLKNSRKTAVHIGEFVALFYNKTEAANALGTSLTQLARFVDGDAMIIDGKLYARVNRKRGGKVFDVPMEYFDEHNKHFGLDGTENRRVKVHPTKKARKGFA